ncbi:MAG: hypothetical protein QOF28_1930 [Actinomycetota bacterium]|jgi:hypothetical protein|nr:hypothetical protein [Actinomycetota bacterium]
MTDVTRRSERSSPPRRDPTLVSTECRALEQDLASDYLRGALLCRYDHPVSECAIMGAEIDRRLQSSRER